MLDTPQSEILSLRTILLVEFPDVQAKKSLFEESKLRGHEVLECTYQELREAAQGESIDLIVFGFSDQTIDIDQLEQALAELPEDSIKAICGPDSDTEAMLHAVEAGVDHYFFTTADNKRVGLFLDLMLVRRQRRKKMLRRQRANEYLLRGIPDLVIVLDREGRYHEAMASEGNDSSFIRPPSELLGRRVSEFFPKAEAKVVMDAVNEVLDTGESKVISYCLTLEGVENWFDGHCAVLDEERELVIWIARDVTKRRVAESEAEQNATLLQAVLDTLPLGIFWKDRDHRFLGMNSTTMHAIGAESLSEVIGKTDYDFENTKAHADHFHEYDAKIMESGEPEVGILEQIDQPEGDPIWLRTNKVPLRDAEGNVTGVLGTFEDISEERTKGVEAERDHANLVASQSLAKIGSWELRTDDGASMWSEELYRIHDMDPSEAPLSWDDIESSFQRGNEAAEFLEACEAMLRDGTPLFITNELTTRSGRKLIVRHQAERVNETTLRGTIQDVTKEYTLRKELEEAQSTSKVGSWRVRLSDGFVEWSDEVFRIHEMPIGRPTPNFSEFGDFFSRESDQSVIQDLFGSLKAPGDRGKHDIELTTPIGNKKMIRFIAEYADPDHIRGTLQDISEEYALQSKLQNAVDDLGTAQRLAKVGSWQRRLSTGERSWSPELYRIHDLEPENPVPSDSEIGAWFPEGEEAQLLSQSLQACAENGEEVQLELWMNTPKGNRKRVKVMAERFGEDLVRGTFQDITESHLQNEALRESKAFLQSVLESMPIGVYWKDLESRFLGANNFFLKTAGLEKLEDIIGKQDHECGVPIEYADVYYKEDQEVIKTRTSIIGKSYELSIPGLPPMWLRGSKVPLIGLNGEVIGVLGSFEDITEEKFLELDRLRSKNLLDSTQEIAQIGGWEWDVKKETLWWTDQTYAIFGIQPDGPPDIEVGISLFHEDYLEDFTARFEALLNEGIPYDIELPFRTIDGKERWGRTTGRPVYEDGEIVRANGIMQDITEERARAEEQQAFEARVQHAQKLESLGVLAGGIAHDFNNLLVSMLGYASMALGMCHENSPVYDKVSNVVDAAKKAADLTKQMLAYSGKGKFVIEEIDLNGLVAEMGNILRVTLPKGVVLKENYAPNLPQISADKAQISQVVMNLISNAGEAIGERSGIVTVSTSVVNAEEEYLSGAEWDNQLDAGYYVCLEVADTGKGMDEETRTKIFDPFFTTKFTGRGLGLAAVLGIVRGHKGAIRVYSEGGKGTTFKVLLPVSSVLRAETPSGSRSIDVLSGHALVVDDEESVRAVAKMILEDVGMQVTTANDGRDGVEKFSQNPDKYSVVILDMTMPHVNGPQAFKEIRKLRPDACVMLSSGYTEQDATSGFEGKGLSGFIQKPYMPIDFVKSVREAMGAEWRKSDKSE